MQQDHDRPIARTLVDDVEHKTSAPELLHPLNIPHHRCSVSRYLYRVAESGAAVMHQSVTSTVGQPPHTAEFITPTGMQDHSSARPRSVSHSPNLMLRRLARMTGVSSSETPQFPRLDFDALYRGESPADGMPAVATPPWDTKAPKENVIAWQTGGWVHGDVLDIGCGLGDNAVYLAKNGYNGHRVGHLAHRPDHRRAAGRGRRSRGQVRGDRLHQARGLHRRVRHHRRQRHVPLPRRRGQTSYAAAAHRATGRAPPCCSVASPTPTLPTRSGRGRRCPRKRCATSSAARAGTSLAGAPQCAAKWTARKSRWRSGTSARSGADWC